MSTIIIHTEGDKLQQIKDFLESIKVQFETKEETYNPEFVAMIEQNRKEYKEGKYKKINLNELWK
jgi:hypothetical protein